MKHDQNGGLLMDSIPARKLLSISVVIVERNCGTAVA
jgi:hypothetical protein